MIVSHYMDIIMPNPDAGFANFCLSKMTQRSRVTLYTAGAALHTALQCKYTKFQEEFDIKQNLNCAIQNNIAWLCAIGRAVFPARLCVMRIMIKIRPCTAVTRPILTEIYVTIWCHMGTMCLAFSANRPATGFLISKKYSVSSRQSGPLFCWCEIVGICYSHQ